MVHCLSTHQSKGEVVTQSWLQAEAAGEPSFSPPMFAANTTCGHAACTRARAGQGDFDWGGVLGCPAVPNGLHKGQGRAGMILILGALLDHAACTRGPARAGGI